MSNHQAGKDRKGFSYKRLALTVPGSSGTLKRFVHNAEHPMKRIHSPSMRTCLLAVGLAALLGATACETIEWRLAMNEGVGHFKSNEFEKAIASFRKAIRIMP